VKLHRRMDYPAPPRLPACLNNSDYSDRGASPQILPPRKYNLISQYHPYKPRECPVVLL